MFFDYFNIIFIIFFTVALGLILFQVVKAISTWIKNNNSEQVTTSARIVAK